MKKLSELTPEEVKELRERDQKNENQENAFVLIEAIKAFNEKPENLENFQFYLENHFSEWFAKWAKSPAQLSAEFYNFATMEI